ncbi:unnamed protein product [Gordionus sp. m RMFG-2023]
MNVQQLFNKPIFRLTCFACGTEGHKAAQCPNNTFVINNNDNNTSKFVNNVHSDHSNPILDRSTAIRGRQAPLTLVMNRNKSFGVRKTLMKKTIFTRKKPSKINGAEEFQQEFAYMGINEDNE